MAKHGCFAKTAGHLVPRRIQTSEAAELLGVSVRMVQKLLALGELPGSRVGSRWTTTTADVAAYLEGRSNILTPHAPQPTQVGGGDSRGRTWSATWSEHERTEEAYRRLLVSRLSSTTRGALPARRRSRTCKPKTNDR